MIVSSVRTRMTRIRTYVLQHYQLVRIGDGQLTEQNLLHEREDSGVGANANRQRDHGNKGECWIPPQLTECNTNVLEYGFHGFHSQRKATIGSIFAARRAGKQ